MLMIRTERYSDKIEYMNLLLGGYGVITDKTLVLRADVLISIFAYKYTHLLLSAAVLYS